MSEYWNEFFIDLVNVRQMWIPDQKCRREGNMLFWKGVSFIRCWPHEIENVLELEYDDGIAWDRDGRKFGTATLDFQIYDQVTGKTFGGFHFDSMEKSHYTMTNDLKSAGGESFDPFNPVEVGRSIATMLDFLRSIGRIE